MSYKASSILSLVFLSFIVLPAAAQTFIPGNLIPPAGTTVNVIDFEATDLTGLDALYAQTGDNQIFDFTIFPYGDPEELSITYIGVDPNSPCASHPAFANANLTFGISTDEGDGLFFGGFGNEGFVNFGSCFIGDATGDGQDNFVVIYNEPGEIFFPPEVRFGTTWTSTFDTFFEIDGELAPIPPTTTTVTNEIDAAGTIFTPGGSTEALRNSSTRTSTISGFPTGSAIVDVEFITSFQSYALAKMTQLSGIGADIDLDENGNPNGASYVVISDGEGGGDPTAVEPVGEGIPTGFDLGQNYPNPFNPSTLIPFDLAEPAHVTINVFDVNGRLVDHLVDQTMAAGSYQVDWQPTGLPSGVYMYQLQASGTTQMKTMIFQK